MILVNKQRYLTEKGVKLFFEVNKEEFSNEKKYKFVVESVLDEGKRYFNVYVYQYSK